MIRKTTKRSQRSGSVWLYGLGILASCSAIIAGFFYVNSGPTDAEIAAGKSLFMHEFTVNDPLCGEGDGLGPVFNERSCVACHFQGGTGGAGPNNNNVTAFEAFPVPGRPKVVAGGVHSFAINSSFEESMDELRLLFPKERFTFEVPNYGGGGCDSGPTFTTRTETFDPVQVDEINTPALFGLAEIEKISNTALSIHSAKRSFGKIGRELEGKFDGTGIGRLRELGPGKAGKFGWKGQFSTVEEFVANACAMELGLTNHKVSQTVPKRFVQDENAKLDMTKQQLYELVSFVKSLPAPQQVIPNDPTKMAVVHRGEKLFSEIGCADCHVRDIGGVEGVYSDFHLYEVEHEKVVDTYVEPEFDPEFTLRFDHPRPSEWQTPPLWGVADSAPYFHDGKSPHLTAAIMRHGRDGKFSRDQFESLKDVDKRAVIAFLQTLRAPQID